jgi:signal transduction histidine kinase
VHDGDNEDASYLFLLLFPLCFGFLVLAHASNALRNAVSNAVIIYHYYYYVLFFSLPFLSLLRPYVLTSLTVFFVVVFRLIVQERVV